MQKKQFIKNLQLTEYKDEEELIELTTQKTMIIHFFNPSFQKCTFMNKALQILSPKFPKIKFACINASLCPKMCKSLKIRVLPYLGFFKDGYFVDELIGFERLGNKSYFDVEDLEKVILESNIMKEVN